MKKRSVCGRDFVEPHNSVMVETGMLRQRFVGVAPLGNAISFWIKGDIMVWSPDILPMWIIFCDCCFSIEDPRKKVGNDRGMA